MGYEPTISSRRVSEGSGFARWLPLAAVVGPALFSVAWLVLGFVSPGFTIWGATVAPYSPISAGISGLGLGPTAPWMNGAFIASGLLVTIGAVGIFRSVPALQTGSARVGMVLLGLSGIGLVIDGIFTLESIMAHTAGFGLGVIGVASGYAFIGRRLRRTPGWQGLGTGLLVASPLALALTALYLATFSPTAEGAMVGVSGLIERILVVEELTPMMVLGWLAFRRQAGDPARH